VAPFGVAPGAAAVAGAAAPVAVVAGFFVSAGVLLFEQAVRDSATSKATGTARSTNKLLKCVGNGGNRRPPAYADVGDPSNEECACLALR
jgi:hypothetical protein